MRGDLVRYGFSLVFILLVREFRTSRAGKVFTASSKPINLAEIRLINGITSELVTYDSPEIVFVAVSNGSRIKRISSSSSKPINLAEIPVISGITSKLVTYDSPEIVFVAVSNGSRIKRISSTTINSSAVNDAGGALTYSLIDIASSQRTSASLLSIK